MKRNYNFARIVLMPKKKTIDFILNFSKSISAISLNKMDFIASKMNKKLLFKKEFFYLFSSKRGSMYCLSLLRRGTLFCPPSFPRDAIQS